MTEHKRGNFLCATTTALLCFLGGFVVEMLLQHRSHGHCPVDRNTTSCLSLKVRRGGGRSRRGPEVQVGRQRCPKQQRGPNIWCFLHMQASITHPHTKLSAHTHTQSHTRRRARFIGPGTSRSRLVIFQIWRSVLLCTGVLGVFTSGVYITR